MPLYTFLLLSLFAALPARSDFFSRTDNTTQTAAIQEWCLHLSKELMSVNYERCIAKPWKFDKTSVQGRPIPYLVLGSDSNDVKIKHVLILGALHGDEITAVSIVFRWIDFLEKIPESDKLRKPKYLIYPLINPDGFYAKPRTRTNAAGIDVNRNFQTKDWDKTALTYWKKRTYSDPRRYPGKTAGSEIETLVVQKAVDDFKPGLIVSVHAPYKVVDHDGPITFTKTLKSPLPIRTLGAFPGSLGTYSGRERETPVVTPELPSATVLPDLKKVEQLLIFIMNSNY